jgi:hypothetical protein
MLNICFKWLLQAMGDWIARYENAVYCSVTEELISHTFL